MKRLLSKMVLVGTALAAAASLAQTPGAESLIEPPANELNRIGMAFRLGFNISLECNNLGAFPARTDPGPAGGPRYDRTYDDGYNRVDISGNNHGPGFANTTWNWGYNNASQVQYSDQVPSALVFHSYSSPGASVSGIENNPYPGFELTYGRQIANREKWRAGIEWAFGYTDLEVQETGPLRTDVARLNDQFSVPPETVSGQPLPPPGYRGRFAGPGPVIGSRPSRSVSALSGDLVGNWAFGADLFCFRLGPYVDLPVRRGLDLGFGAGAAIIYAHSDFDYWEAHSIPGAGTFLSTGNGSDSEVLPGGYVAGSVAARLAENWQLFGGAQLFMIKDYSQAVNGREAVLELGKSIFVTVGLSYSF